MMEIFKEFTFDSAHLLPHVPKGHKCGRLHGHTYTVRIYLDADVDPTTGWVVDFAELKRVYTTHCAILDHTYLNEIEGLENPTCEHIARWIWERLQPDLPQLSKIAVFETPSSGCIYDGKKER
jgi:6-pyruvoyltetrahydropterin/6-carboxytetrahydropterin synthase